MEQKSIEGNGRTIQFLVWNEKMMKSDKKWTWKGVILIKDEKNIQSIWYYMEKTQLKMQFSNLFLLVYIYFWYGAKSVQSLETSKGQLISKGLFVFFNSSKKRTKNFCPSRLGQKLTLSSSFFGRIEDTKISFRD